MESVARAYRDAVKRPLCHSCNRRKIRQIADVLYNLRRHAYAPPKVEQCLEVVVRAMVGHGSAKQAGASAADVTIFKRALSSRAHLGKRRARYGSCTARDPRMRVSEQLGSTSDRKKSNILGRRPEPGISQGPYISARSGLTPGPGGESGVLPAVISHLSSHKCSLNTCKPLHIAGCRHSIGEDTGQCCFLL